jgi:hypothetical protein
MDKVHKIIITQQFLVNIGNKTAGFLHPWQVDKCASNTNEI